MQRLRRYILIHNTTFEQIRQKDVEHFIFFYQGAKKINKNMKREHWGIFLWICQFYILMFSLQCLMYYFAIRRQHKGLDEIKLSFGC